MDDFEKEIKLCFLEEASDITSELESCFLELETGGYNEETLDRASRAAHNLKGGSQSVGFKEFGWFTHKIENVIVAVKEKVIDFDKDTITVILEAIDHLKAFSVALTEDTEASYPTKEIETKLVNVLKEGGQNPTDEKVEAPPIVEKESVEVVPPPVVEKPSPNAAKKESSPKEQKSRSPKQATKREETIKVSLTKLDSVLNLVGELVVHQNILNQICTKYKEDENEELKEVVSYMSTIVADLQGSSFGLRMIPFQGTLQLLRRAARDISSQQKKEIEFCSSGEAIEMDKSVVHGISEPLNHLIRNGIDHGIESPDERILAGKPQTARLAVSVRQDADKVIIEIEDDGRGLQTEKILEKAIASGMTTPNQSLGNEEIHNFIFRPGFSTKDAVTDLSGRGVGMDVVRQNIKALNGEIFISSEEGKGTKFTIQLPLSVAIIDGMVCEIQKDLYIIPLSNLNEVHRVDIEQVGSVNRRSEIAQIRGEEIPVFDLGSVLTKNGKPPAEPQKNFFGVSSIIDGRKYFFKVDKLIGVQPIVIKKLGAEISNLPGLAGSAVLGDGSAGLILDLPSLIHEKIAGVS